MGNARIAASNEQNNWWILRIVNEIAAVTLANHLPIPIASGDSPRSPGMRNDLAVKGDAYGLIPSAAEVHSSLTIPPTVPGRSSLSRRGAAPS